jgi:hypothetical protein
VRKKRPALSLITSFFILLSFGEAGNSQKPEWKGKTVFENGINVVKNPREPLCGELKLEPDFVFPQDKVIVVHNPKTPSPVPGFPSTLALKEDLVIGKETAKEDYWFSELNSLAVDDSGNIYTVDPKDIRIRIFDSKGKLIRVFGRKGQGPGEFQAPGRIEIGPEGFLVVQDVLNNRLSYLTPDGKSLKDVPLRWRGAVRLAGDGAYYLSRIERRGDRLVNDLVKIDSSQRPIVQFCTVEAIIMKKGAMNFFPGISFFEVMKGNNIIWLFPSTYEMHIASANGETIKRIIKDHDSVKISRADKERMTKLYSSPPGFKLEFPENYPAVGGLVVDDRDWIFVRTYEKDGVGKVYHDVFEPGGRYVARFSLPENERIAAIKAKKLCCLITESEKGIPLVKRYAMEWK